MSPVWVSAQARVDVCGLCRMGPAPYLGIMGELVLPLTSSGTQESSLHIAGVAGEPA